MFFIDIAVPRDVDPTMNAFDGMFVYDIDDLQQVAASHMEERSRQAMDAETLIAAEVGTLPSAAAHGEPGARHCGAATQG